MSCIFRIRSPQLREMEGCIRSWLTRRESDRRLSYLQRISRGIHEGLYRTINRLSYNPVTRRCLMGDDARPVKMPPLRRYEMPDSPATALDFDPEPDEFSIPSERMTAEEIRSLPRPIEMPPLHVDELPDSAVSVLRVKPDPVLDEPSWGLCSKAPEIVISRQKMLHPWDDDPAEIKEETKPKSRRKK